MAGGDGEITSKGWAPGANNLHKDSGRGNKLNKDNGAGEGYGDPEPKKGQVIAAPLPADYE